MTATAIFVQDGENGIASEIELDGQLKTYQTLVSGYIEIVEAGGVTFVLDEEGKVKNKPVNHRATEYLYTIAPEWVGWDLLCGPVVILGLSGDSTEPTNVPRSALEYFELT